MIICVSTGDDRCCITGSGLSVLFFALRLGGYDNDNENDDNENDDNYSHGF